MSDSILAAFQIALAESRAAERACVDAAGRRGSRETERLLVKRDDAADRLSDLCAGHVDKLIAVAVYAKQYTQTEDDESDAALVALTEALAALEKPQ